MRTVLIGLAIVLAAQAGDGGSVGAQCGELLEQGRRGIAGSVEADGDRHQLLDNRLVGSDS